MGSSVATSYAAPSNVQIVTLSYNKLFWSWSLENNYPQVTGNNGVNSQTEEGGLIFVFSRKNPWDVPELGRTKIDCGVEDWGSLTCPLAAEQKCGPSTFTSVSARNSCCAGRHIQDNFFECLPVFGGRIEVFFARELRCKCCVCSHIQTHYM
jgi:hypothetical protein